MGLSRGIGSKNDTRLSSVILEAATPHRTAPLSFDVLDARGRVRVQLSSSLPQQKFNGGKISLFNSEILLKLGPDDGVSLLPSHQISEGILEANLANASKCFRLVYNL